MTKKVFVDTNVVLRIILQKEKELYSSLVESFTPYVPVNVLEEAAFKIIIETVSEETGKTSFYQIKNTFQKRISDTLDKRLHALDLFAQSINVVSITEGAFQKSRALITQYRLLPNDALIVAACEIFGIETVITDDSDFKNTDRLTIVSPNDIVFGKS